MVKDGQVENFFLDSSVVGNGAFAEELASVFVFYCDCVGVKGFL